MTIHYTCGLIVVTFHFLQDIFATRDTKDIVDSINDIQLLEKEKLLLVAAQHLDKMHLSIPSLGANMGNLSLTTTETNSKYAIDKMRQLEQKISESLENFQSLKCDYSEM